MIATTTDVATRLHAAAHEIWNRSRAATLSRVDTIEHAVTSLLTGTLDERERDVARREAHRLAGTAGTFGFQRGSELARELEAAFADPAGLVGDAIRQMAEQVLELRLVLEQPSPTSPATAPASLPRSDRDVNAGADHADPLTAGADGGAAIRSASVLVIDDDATSLAVVAAQLQSMGHTAATLDEPMRTLDVVARTAPDLVVLDVDMPEVTGIELVRMLRSEPRSRHVPILVLTARTDAALVRDAYAAGADDVVHKTELYGDFGVRVSNRLERARQMRAASAGMGAHTDVIDRQEAARAMERLMRLARRHRRPACIALIHLDDFAAVGRRHGRNAGEAVLRRVADTLTAAFRNDDLVARWGRDTFVVAMFDADAQQGERRLQDVLDTLRAESFGDAKGGAFSVTASAGLAQRSRAHPDGASVLAAAEQALLDAQSSGRRSVVVSGTAPAVDDRVVDVVLVEDDPALAALLMHALESDGVRASWLPDGQQASDRLCGPCPALRARVVLMDVSLPGLDGLTLLRQLAAADALRATRVIVISARASEGEMLLAFSLGAFDFVAKPVSVPLLMQRVHRAMHA